MGQRLNYGQAKTGLGDTVFVDGNFVTNGGSNPTTFSKGPFTVTRSAAGEITITLKENVVEFLSIIPKIGGPAATANNDAVFCKSSSVGTQSANATIVLETQTIAGTAGDLTGIGIHFHIAYRKGTLTK